MTNALEDALKSVVFLGFLNQKTDVITTVGTAFIVATDFSADPNRGKNTVLVTARHVIANLQARGTQIVFVRFNDTFSKSFWRKTLIEDWVFEDDPKNDVASYHAKLPLNVDHLAVLAPTFMPNKDVRPFTIDLTDEVVVAGLFSPHQSEFRVTPLLRVGNIVGLAEESSPVSTPVGTFAAHLVEMRSISGLSGAPVFAKAGLRHTLTGKVKPKGAHVFLLGLLSGHFVEKEVSIRSSGAEPDVSKLDLNAGISFVTPTEIIKAHLDRPPPADGRTRLYFPAHTNLSEGSFFNAIRYLSADGISKFAELLPQVATLTKIDAGIDKPQPINARALARILLNVAVEDLKKGGWDGKTV